MKEKKHVCAISKEDIPVIEFKILYRCPYCNGEQEDQIRSYYKRYSAICKYCIEEFIVEF